MSTFEQFNLDSNIYKAIEACGYTKPTPVQTQSIPEILNGRDVVVSAQTGTGKTAAFVLPALHYLSQQESTKKTRILVLTPTRELATQITKAASKYGKFLRFNIVELVGGMSYYHQIKDLNRGADIIVATPGRLMDHMEQKRVDLSNIDMLVLDEADRMLDMGFIDDVQYIAKLTPSKRQTLLFSATLDNKLMSAVKHLLKSPARIDLSESTLAAPKIKQEMYKAKNIQHKTKLLKHFLQDKNIFKAIIFSSTKINADRLADELRYDGFSAAALHGDLRQNVRTRTLDQLRQGRIQYLVATDVAARGIDVSDITHVINFDLPRSSEDYVHRIGRTGRAGKEGIAISFVLPTEMRQVQFIERFMGQRIKLISDVELRETPKHKSEDSDEILSLDKNKEYKTSDDSKISYRKSRKDDDRPFKSRGEDRGDRPFKSRDGDRPFKSRGEDRGDRPFKSRDGDRPFKSRGEDRDDRPFKSRDGDRPFKSRGEDRDDRPFKSRDGDRPFKSRGEDRGDRPFKSRDGDRPFKSRGEDRGERSDRPFKSRDGDRPFKSRGEDRGDRPFKSRGEGSDRPSFKSREDRGDRPFKSRDGDRSDRPFKSRDGDRPFKSRGEDRGDRPFKSRGEGSDRPSFKAREDRGDRPFKSRDGDKPFKARGEGSDRPFKSRSKSSDRSDRPFKSREDRGDKKDGFKSEKKFSSAKREGGSARKSVESKYKRRSVEAE